jgi:DNA (cytosine-5)-methyltransferase 1
MKNKEENYAVLDLFCGIGGFSKGFEKAGFHISAGIDNWKVALETFEKNHKKSKAIYGDLRDLKDSVFKEFSGKIDVIIAGPPCQGFSMSGKRDINDKRNTLFEEVIRAVKLIRPKVVIIENVVGLLSMVNPDGEPIKDLIYRKLQEEGYEVEHRVFNASEHGVPQSRKRVVFIGSRIGQIDFPRIQGDAITVGDALGNLPDVEAKVYGEPKTEFQKLMADGERNIYNHEKMKHNKEVLERITYVPAGGNWQDIPPKFYNVGGEHSNNYRRLDPKKPSITLKHATKSMIIHPKFDRVITAREVARLQSFPDSFILSGTRFEQHQQLANAVPPLLAFEIAKMIKQKLEKNEI